MMLACQPRGLFLQSQPNTTYGYLIGARSQRRAVPLPKRGAGPVQAVQGENGGYRLVFGFTEMCKR